MKVFKVWMERDDVFTDVNDIYLFKTRERANQAALEMMFEVQLSIPDSFGDVEFEETQNTATQISYYSKDVKIGIYVCEEGVH
jgi:hypothetical protein